MPWLLAEKYRVLRTPLYASRYGDDYGAFVVPSPKGGQELKIIANAANPDSEWWEHVSVSLRNRTPNWAEMCFVKSLFWGDDETVMQLHVPAAEHVNVHPNCLHLFRPTKIAIPQPPVILV